MLNHGAQRVTRVVGPRGDQLREDLGAVGGGLRERPEPGVGRCEVAQTLPFGAELHEVLMEALQGRPLALAVRLERGRELVLELQRAVRGRACFPEQEVAELAEPVPVRVGDDVPSLQPHPGRKQHTDPHLDAIPVELVERTVVPLAEEAQEQIDDERLEPIGLAEVICDGGPGDRVLVDALEHILDVARVEPQRRLGLAERDELEGHSERP